MKSDQGSDKKLKAQEEKDNPYSFYQVRNYQAQQEGIFLALLNQEFDIVLEVPQKKSVVALNYIRIIKFSNDHETIEFGAILHKKLVEMFNEDKASGITENTASRRLEINKIAESIHLLIEMLQKRKYDMKTTLMGKRNVRSSAIEISFDGIVLDKNEIERRGELIIRVLIERMKGLQRKETVIVKKSDIEIMSLLLS